MEPAFLFCIPLLPVLKRTREKCRQGVLKRSPSWTASALEGSDTVDVAPFLQRELTNIGIATNPRKTVDLPPKEQLPTLEEIAILEGIDVHTTERGGAKVVGVSIGTDAHAMESAMEIVESGGAEQLALTLPRMPDKQSDNLIATGSVVHRTAYIEW